MKNIHQNWDTNLFYEYLEKFQLPKDKSIKEYSKGMNMKLRIATALSHHPQILILDEATSGLDPVARSEILTLFQEFLEKENHTIFISSHITTDLEQIADYIIFIHNGKIILNKSRDELLEEYGIAKVTKEEFEKINKKDYLKYKKQKYEVDLLIENKKSFEKKYKIKVMDKPTLENIMILMVKGEEL